MSPSDRPGPPEPDGLEEVLERGRTLGFLGPGPIDGQISHALAFGQGRPTPSRALDLGAGGGLPGLVLAARLWPTCHWILLDAGQRRSEFLAESVERLGLAARVEVVHARAEIAGRRPELRGSCDLVTSRGFGPPAVTAECGAPFLVVGGELVVSEPPGGSRDRWSAAAPLAELGLEVGSVDHGHGASLAVLRAARLCPERYPRRDGIPAKRPLF